MDAELVCPICHDWNKDVLFKEVPPEEYVAEEHDMSIYSEDLKDSAEAGCSRCGVLQDILCHFCPLWRTVIDQGCDAIAGLQALTVSFNKPNLSRIDEDEHNYLAEVWTYWNSGLSENVGIDISTRQGLSSISGDTSSTQSTVQAKSWLAACLDSHKLCNDKRTSLPKRVVDVSPCRRGELPRLLDTIKAAQKIQPYSDYLALSHCWGKIPIIHTTKCSLDQRIEGIPWQALSKTFQDAIDIALDFGVDYIWIDSLCIVQDDEFDWQEQAGQMASIYEHCLFAISATASTDGNGGCYRISDEQNSRIIPFTRSRKGNNEKVWSAFARKAIQHPDNEIRSGDGSEVDAPLIDRAWVFQEHLLAPRLLQYTATEIMWECNEMLICECGRVDPKRYQRKGAAPRANDPLEDAGILKEWRHLVSSYTMRKLSYFSDRLPALSGLAQRTQQRFLPEASSQSTNRYLAGLWERDLVTGLGWTAVGDPIVASRTSSYCALTWSWASVEGHIYWPTDINAEREPVTRIIRASCDLAGPDPTGAVVGGKITLSGLAIEVAVSEYRFTKQRNTIDQLRHFISYCGLSTDNFEECRDEQSNTDEIQSDYQWAEPGDLYIPPGEKLICLRLGWERRSKDLEAAGYTEERYPSSGFRCILLRPSKTVAQAFERVGALSTRPDDLDDPLQKWFQDAEEIQVTIV